MLHPCAPNLSWVKARARAAENLDFSSALPGGRDTCPPPTVKPSGGDRLGVGDVDLVELIY
jgi:hypothetical protein